MRPSTFAPYLPSLFAGTLSVAVLVALAACSGGGSSSSPATPASTPTPVPSSSHAPTPSPAPTPSLAPAAVVNSTASPLYLDENPSTVYGSTAEFGTIKGAAGFAAIDGIGCGGMETLTTHYHVHLTIYDNGTHVALPAGTGIYQPVPYQPTLQYGPYFVWDSYPQNPHSCFYAIHMHALMGMVHIEYPAPNFIGTLGEFFDIAGLPLTVNGVGSALQGTTRWFDTDETTGAAGSHPVTELTATDPHFVPLLDHHEYTVEIGPAWDETPNFTFSPNYH